MLKNKNVLITGASRGIGRGIATVMAGYGANIAIVYAGNKQMAESAKAEILAMGVKAETYQCDVSDFTLSKAVIEKVISDFGSIDVLVNNAGITNDKLLLRMSEDDWDKVLDINLKGSFNMIKHVTSSMMRARKGRIINLSSVTGLMGNMGQVNYAASKAGVIGLTKSVAKELATRNITCNAIAPGFIQSDMTDALTDEQKDYILKGVPLGSVGKPEDVGELAAFLASDKASYITGQCIKVDGGLYI